jgi:hypothetical protein
MPTRVAKRATNIQLNMAGIRKRTFMGKKREEAS